MNNDLLEFRRNFIYFKETTEDYKTLNKIITKYTNIYKNNNNYTITEINNDIVADIFIYCKQKNIDLENFDKKYAGKIANYLKRKLIYTYNNNLDSFVLSENGKSVRVFIKKQYMQETSTNENINFKNEATKEDYKYYKCLNLKEEIENIKKRHNEDLFNYFIDVLNNKKELKNSEIRALKQTISNTKTYTYRYNNLLNIKYEIQEFLTGLTGKTLDEFLNELDDVVYDYINVNNKNENEIINELLNFIDFIDNFNDKYKKEIKKDYNLNEHIREIRKQNKDAKYFTLDSNGIIIDFE